MKRFAFTCLLAVFSPTQGAAFFDCTELRAVKVCREKHPKTDDYSLLNDCIALETLVCHANKELEDGLRETISTDNEWDSLRECVLSFEHPYSSLTVYDCFSDFIRERSSGVYQSFLAEGQVKPSPSVETICVWGEVDPNSLLRCLHSYQDRFEPIEE